MTSKEKLDSLVFKCAFSEYDNIDEFIELHIKQSSNYKEIYQDLDRLEKLEKVVEIIKNKQVVIFALFHSDSASEYNFMRNEKYHLTQEEFELLKEVLQDVKD